MTVSIEALVAGQAVIARLDASARILTECIRLRTGKGLKSYVEPFSRRRDALAAMDAMILSSKP